MKKCIAESCKGNKNISVLLEPKTNKSYKKRLSEENRYQYRKIWKGFTENAIFSSSTRSFAKKYKDLIVFDDKALERLKDSLRELTF